MIFSANNIRKLLNNEMTLPWVAFLVAVPTTIFLGMASLICFFLGMGTRSSLLFVFGLFSVLGICGLWMRAIVQPLIGNSSRLTHLITLFLFFGTASSSCFAYWVISNMKPANGIKETLIVLALTILPICGLTLGILNIFPRLTGKSKTYSAS